MRSLGTQIKSHEVNCHPSLSQSPVIPVHRNEQHLVRVSTCSMSRTDLLAINVQRKRHDHLKPKAGAWTPCTAFLSRVKRVEHAEQYRILGRLVWI